MGKPFSRQAESDQEITSEWIEKLYEARAAACRAEKNSQLAEQFNATNDDETGKDGKIEVDTKVMNATVDDEDESDEPKAKVNETQAIFYAEELASMKGMDNVANPDSALDAATVQLTKAMHATAMKAHQTLETATEKLRELGVIAVAGAVTRWIKEHPWETAAIVVSLILLACTPAFLGIAGFTAGGVAVGSIGAGIQAGIGSVAAGSVFATLTSAAMFGYGVPIVFGGVWLTSSAVMWSITAWKRWGKSDADTADGGDRAGSDDSNNSDGDGDGGDGGKVNDKAIVKKA